MEMGQFVLVIYSCWNRTSILITIALYLGTFNDGILELHNTPLLIFN
jgi:hypothetical protein